MPDDVRQDLWLWATGSSSNASTHREALGAHRDVADGFARLHFDALRAASLGAGPHPSREDEAMLTVLAHSFNLYVTLVRLRLAGQFDIALYLLRQQLDTASLIYGCGRDSDLAARFMGGEKVAAEARKKLIAEIREADSDLADELNNRFLDENVYLQEATHSGPAHLARLLEATEDSIHPTALGHFDAENCIAFFRQINYFEHFALSSCLGVRESWLDEDWRARLDELQATFASLGRRADPEI